MGKHKLSWAMIIVGLAVFAIGAYSFFAGNERFSTPIAAGALLLSAGALMRRRERMKEGSNDG